MSKLRAILLYSALLIGCGDGKDKGAVDLCAGQVQVEGCGTACDASVACPTGLFCGSDGKCTAECKPNDSQYACSTGFQCNTNGRCVAIAGDSGNACEDAKAKTLNVLFLIERASSMGNEIETGVDRRDAIHDVLVHETEGVIARYQKSVRFGLALYTSFGSFALDPSAPATYNWTDQYKCVDESQTHPTGPGKSFVKVDLGLNHLKAIRAAYTNLGGGGDASTAAALKKIEAIFPKPQAGTLNRIIWVTDGDSDSCPFPNPLDDFKPTPRDFDANGTADYLQIRTEVVSLFKAFYSKGIATHVVAIAAPSAELNVDPSPFFADVANVGKGRPTGSTSMAYHKVTDVKSLGSAFNKIMSELVAEATACP